MRIVHKDYDLYYSAWCNNEHELYDIRVRKRGVSVSALFQANLFFRQTQVSYATSLPRNVMA